MVFSKRYQGWELLGGSPHFSSKKSDQKSREKSSQKRHQKLTLLRGSLLILMKEIGRNSTFWISDGMDETLPSSESPLAKGLKISGEPTIKTSGVVVENETIRKHHHSWSK